MHEYHWGAARASAPRSELKITTRLLWDPEQTAASNYTLHTKNCCSACINRCRHISPTTQGNAAHFAFMAFMALFIAFFGASAPAFAAFIAFIALGIAVRNYNTPLLEVDWLRPFGIA